MLRLILILLSYILGLIISHFTKEELIIRKDWLHYWKYLLFFIPIFFFINKNLLLIFICFINYFKASEDFILKISLKNKIISNIIFLVLGLIVIIL